MIILSATTDILEVKMGGAKTSNEAQCAASWRDITTTTFTPDRTVINTNGNTPVNAVGSPGASTQRVVDLLNVYNADTVTQTITVTFNANGTRYTLISASLLTGESLQYIEGAGWQKLTASGAITGVSGIAGTANEITTSAATGAITLSLPTALTFTGKTVTGGTFSSPTLVTPALGTPASGNLASCTGYTGTTALVTGGAMTLTSLSTGGQIISTLATGTAPLAITSTTQVANLNVSIPASSDYGTGAWTPVGNGITLTVNAANYTVIGRLVVLQFDVTWPVTADGGQAKIHGFPFNPMASWLAGGVLGYCEVTTAGRFYSDTTDLYLTTSANAILTNANCSGARVSGTLCYFK